MEKLVKIGEHEIKFRTSAALPHMYRRKFKRDIFVDMDALRKTMKKDKDGKGRIDIDSLEMFENLAWCFAKHADPEVPDDVETWLERFETFDIYNIMPDIFAMWTNENAGTSKLKKKNGK